jgi:hypothetical protein
VYIIRADADRPLLNVELSGFVSTEEALRAISQAGTLAEAGHARVIRCDIHTVQEGPDCRPLVAAALAANSRPSFAVAFVGQPEKLRSLRPLLRRLATVGRVQCFESNAAAEAFIGEVCGLRTSLPATAQRHVDDLFGSQSPPPSPAASASRRATA